MPSFVDLSYDTYTQQFGHIHRLPAQLHGRQFARTLCHNIHSGIETAIPFSVVLNAVETYRQQGNADFVWDDSCWEMLLQSSVDHAKRNFSYIWSEYTEDVLPWNARSCDLLWFEWILMASKEADNSIAESRYTESLYLMGKHLVHHSELLPEMPAICTTLYEALQVFQRTLSTEHVVFSTRRTQDARRKTDPITMGFKTNHVKHVALSHPARAAITLGMAAGMGHAVLSAFYDYSETRYTYKPSLVLRVLNETQLLEPKIVQFFDKMESTHHLSREHIFYRINDTSTTGRLFRKSIQSMTTTVQKQYFNWALRRFDKWADSQEPYALIHEMVESTAWLNSFEEPFKHHVVLSVINQCARHSRRDWAMGWPWNHAWDDSVLLSKYQTMDDDFDGVLLWVKILLPSHRDAVCMLESLGSTPELLQQTLLQNPETMSTLDIDHAVFDTGLF